MNKKVYKIVVSGLLIALSVVLTRIFALDIIIAGIPGARLAIGFVPIILGSILLGPFFGAGIGALADIIGFMFFPKGAYFPLVTLTSALVGILPYLIMRITSKLKKRLQLLLSIGITQIVCSMFLQSLWLSIMMSQPYEVFFYPRVIVALFTIPIYFLIIYAILATLKKTKYMPKE